MVPKTATVLVVKARALSNPLSTRATVLKEGALPTGSTGSGIECSVPPVDLWTCAAEARKEFKMN